MLRSNNLTLWTKTRYLHFYFFNFYATCKGEKKGLKIKGVTGALSVRCWKGPKGMIKVKDTGQV